MIFGEFFSKNFSFDISQWSSPLSDWKTGIVIVAYFCLNCFLPLCFELLELRLTVASITAFLLVWFYLYFSGGKIAEICSFQKPKQGEAVKIFRAVFLSCLLCFIFNYWSGEFFRWIGLSVAEEQGLTETLKDSSLPAFIIIGFITIVLAPIGEEIVFRRFLYGILSPLGAPKALLLTSFLFSIAHFYPVGIPGLFFFAMILQLIYLNTRNIWCPIQVHIVFNTLSFISVLAGRN